MAPARVFLCVLLLLCSALCAAGANASASKSADECRSLGFVSAQCADCETLVSILHDDELGDDCRRCCVEDEKEEGILYDKAVRQLPPQQLIF